MNTLNWLVRLSYIKHDHFTCKIFIINLNRLNVLLWNQNQFLISYPGTEQYNLLILNSARVASYAKVTGSLSTLELTRYRLPLQQTSTTQNQGQGSSTISTPSWRFTLRFSRRCSTRFFLIQLLCYIWHWIQGGFVSWSITRCQMLSRKACVWNAKMN